MGKIKVLRLAACAVIALSAVHVSAANAAEGTAVVSSGVTGFSGVQTGGGHTFTLPGGRTLSCTTLTFSGAISNGAKEVKATPNYANCIAKVGATSLPVTLEPTECAFRYYDLTTTAFNTYSAKTDLTCPAGQGIHTKLYSNAASHAAGTRLCEYKIDPQTGLTGSHLTDNADGTVSIKTTELSIQLTRTFGTAGNCGETTTTSRFNGDTLVTPASGILGLDD